MKRNSQVIIMKGRVSLNRRFKFNKMLYVCGLVSAVVLLTFNFNLSKIARQVQASPTSYHIPTISPEVFTFPEVNETRILRDGGRHFDRVQTLYFIELNETFKGGVPTGSGMPAGNDLLAFQPGLTRNEREALLMVFQNFVRACIRFNVTFFIYGGTLLGSLRHHDIIPWDDDIDVIANSSDRLRLRQALLSVPGHFGLNSPRGQRWKFYWTKPRTILHKPFRWPYIDIFFFLENETHIFDESFDYRETFSFPKQHVFPLCLRPFAGSLLPVPRDSDAVVKRNYSPSLCTSLSYSHKLETSTRQSLRATLPCKHLHGLYPFVHHELRNGRVHEKLSFRNQVLGTFVVPSGCQGISFGGKFIHSGS